ncbi:NADH-quinone oxidoreductase subunit NuoH [Rubricoccus marinus]|uniref:NADH-quinone oxidoreductase subunit H n=1 Tax=Rubricoccus marinus TaxID=716817 RepID=A0A259U0D8_9BACT|nr:NADH-quinone oxidoreductase subunit NuoH [Rubricoccus marinus]OZC03441.1 NADH-quinone oxidoreductase subunit H [Rubricoccus marinus]
MELLVSVWQVVDLPLAIFLVINLLLVTASLLVYAERVVSAFIQERSGPNRVGPRGLLQPFADVFKLLFKEDIVPTAGNGFIHSLAPVLMVVIAMSTAAVIPFAGSAAGGPVVIADVSVGLLLILAMTSISVYGITLAGWASNSKYSLLGGLRSSAQMISYELAMGAAALSVVLYAGSLSMFDIVESQNEWGILGWNIFRNPVGFVVFAVCALAETNRAPFDLPEAEQELVGGYHTEYSGMKFGMFFLAEYVNLWIASMVVATLFLGGYLLPFQGFFVDVLGVDGLLLTALQMITLVAKTAFFAFCFIWIRWTLPRFKYDQLMNLGWKYLLPIAIANIFVIALVVIGLFFGFGVFEGRTIPGLGL